ncbi:Chymotrypsin-1 [Pseudolycoriella hygida]|uniref:Chymotrypsin-1 n=1 Tax=Pseudolycoriella hygida TaxID=35572 RepID=A0A9Q0MLN9_9DIPT|nr:Chymotrypsin-1 [Pseudolycoriella hygida]
MMYWAILLFCNFVKVLCVPHPIVGGRTAQPNTYGYQASLRYATEAIEFHFCGGSIISDKCILTAAHCYEVLTKPNRELSRVHVYVGTIYAKKSPNDKGDMYGVESFKKHEQFNRTSLINDLAVVTTDKPIRFNFRVWPIKLATIRPPDGSFITVTGWGYIKNGVKVIPRKLQVINLKMMSLTDCMALNPLDPSCPLEKVTETNICIVGNVGQSTCQGDSGGPAAYNGELVGAISFGADQCGDGKPSVMTCVIDYIEWIRNQTEMH